MVTHSLRHKRSTATTGVVDVQKLSGVAPPATAAETATGGQECRHGQQLRMDNKRCTNCTMDTTKTNLNCSSVMNVRNKTKTHNTHKCSKSQGSQMTDNTHKYSKSQGRQMRDNTHKYSKSHGRQMTDNTHKCSKSHARQMTDDTHNAPSPMADR